MVGILLNLLIMYNYSYFDKSLGHKVLYENLSTQKLTNRLIWDQDKDYQDVTITLAHQPKRYNIFFARDNDQFTEKVSQYRSYAGNVEASSLEEAFAKSQNGNNSDWDDYNTRSTSVGDFISDGENMYMVASQGFTPICKVSVDNTFEIVNLMNEQLAIDEEREFNEQLKMDMVDDMIQHDMMTQDFTENESL
jgi:hypothetical protein